MDTLHSKTSISYLGFINAIKRALLQCRGNLNLNIKVNIITYHQLQVHYRYVVYKILSLVIGNIYPGAYSVENT